LTIIQNGRILLGAEVSFGRYTPYDDDENAEQILDKEKITVEAVSVKWENLDANEFSIPKDFIKRSLNYNDYLKSDSLAVADSAMMLDQMMNNVDTTVMSPGNKPVKKPSTNPQTPAKPKSKTGSTKTGAIRKPD
jgi:hypothetical protein